MNQEELYDWRDTMIDGAKNNILKDGELVPVTLLLVRQPTGETQMINMVMDMSSDMTKTIQAMQIREMCKMFDVLGLVFMSEVWMAEDTQENVEENGFTPPSQREDRIEALMVNFESKENSQVFVFKMVRDDDGNVSEFVPQPQGDFDNYQGRFANFMGNTQ